MYKQSVERGVLWTELRKLKIIISDFTSSNTEIHIHFSLPRKVSTCPHCHSLTDKVHDYRTSIIKDLPSLPETPLPLSSLQQTLLRALFPGCKALPYYYTPCFLCNSSAFGTAECPFCFQTFGFIRFLHLSQTESSSLSKTRQASDCPFHWWIQRQCRRWKISGNSYLPWQTFPVWYSSVPLTDLTSAIFSRLQE